MLTTVSHLNAFLFDLRLSAADGMLDTLGVTGYHKFFTEDRGWVSVCDLIPGEQVRGEYGILTVTNLEREPDTFRVYNMTVEADHVYYVGSISALVHNSWCGDLGEAVKRGMRVFHGEDAPQQVVDILRKMGRNEDIYKVGEVIHAAKDFYGIGAAEDIVFDYSGGMWDSRSGDYLGKIWEW